MAWTPPGAGALTERITIKRRSQISDGMGGYEDAWVNVATAIPAKITAKRGGEQVQSERLSGLSPTDIVVRADARTRTITAEDVVIDDRTGRHYAIKWAGNLEDNGRSRFVMLVCEAGSILSQEAS